VIAPDTALSGFCSHAVFPFRLLCHILSLGFNPSSSQRSSLILAALPGSQLLLQKKKKTAELDLQESELLWKGKYFHHRTTSD